MFLVFNTAISNARFPLANWFIFAATIAASIWAFAQPEIFWTTLADDAPWGWRFLLWTTFLHGDLAHLAGNMYFLLVFGNSVAGGLSAVNYLVLYAALGLFASVISGVMLGTFSIGASGAIAGLMGFFMVAFWKTFLRVWIPPFPFLISVPSVLFIAMFIGFDIYLLSEANWQVERVNYWAHIGGAAGGLCFAVHLKMRGDL